MDNTGVREPYFLNQEQTERNSRNCNNNNCKIYNCQEIAPKRYDFQEMNSKDCIQKRSSSSK